MAKQTAFLGEYSETTPEQPLACRQNVIAEGPRPSLVNFFRLMHSVDGGKQASSNLAEQGRSWSLSADLTSELGGSRFRTNYLRTH